MSLTVSTRKKRGAKKPKYGVPGLTGMVKQVLLREQQSKFLDFAQPAVSFDSWAANPYVSQLTNVDQYVGSGAGQFNQRLGLRINMESLHIRGTMGLASGILPPDNNNGIRLLVVRTRDPDGVGPLWSDVTDGGVGTGSTYLQMPSVINVKYGKFYTIVADLLFNIGPGSVEQAKFDIHIPLRGQEATFSTTAGTAQLTNMYTLLAASDSLVNPDPTIAFVSRLTFVDAL
jgi:hypothetical protein